MAEAKWIGVLSTTEPRNDVGIIKVRQGNINSEIAEFQIVQNNKPYDLTGLTVYFCASFGLNLVEKPAVVVNATGGRIQYTFDDDSMQAVGRQKGYFSIKKAKSKIDSTQDFEFHVDSSLMSRSIDGKSYIYKLSVLIKLLEDYASNGQVNFDVWFESVKEILYGVDPGGNILRELNSIKEQLSQIDKGHVKRLKQPLCANVFAHAEFTVPFLKSQIDEYIDLGLDGIIVVIHLDYENGAMKPRENMSNVMEMITYAQSKGLIIEALKIHWKKEGSSHADPVPEEEKPAYESYVNTLATQFAGITSKITIFNEKDNVTNFSSNDAFVNRVIANVKSKGFEVGMTINDLQYYGMNLNLLNELDFIGYNMYPVVGWKRDKTTLQDCLDAINVSPEKKILYDLIELFPDKEVVISEFGIKDYYAYYASPTDWKYDIPSDKSNGRVAKNYYQALFEVVNGKMDGIWTWYEIYLPDSIKMFQNWTGGTNK